MQDVGHERAIDLDAIHRQPSQVVQAGETGAEIVEPQLDPGIAQPPHQAAAVDRLVQHRGLGEFQVQAVRRQADLREDLGHLLRQPGIAQLAHRQVDRNEQRGVRLGGGTPLHRIDAGLADHLWTQLLDQARFLRHRDEHRGRDHAVFGMLPAQQRFGAHDGAIGHPQHRLVAHRQLAAHPCVAQLLFHPHATLDHLLHAAVVEAVAVLARGLGLVHGDVAILDQRAGAGGVVGEQGDADRCAQEDAVIGIELYRTRQFHHQRLRDARRAGRDVACVAFARLKQEHELIAAETRDFPAAQVGRIHHLADTTRHFHQHAVTHVMAQGVVDALEVIQIDEQQGHRVVFALGLQSHVQPLAEIAAVG